MNKDRKKAVTNFLVEDGDIYGALSYLTKTQFFFWILCLRFKYWVFRRKFAIGLVKFDSVVQYESRLIVEIFDLLNGRSSPTSNWNILRIALYGSLAISLSFFIKKIFIPPSNNSVLEEKAKANDTVLDEFVLVFGKITARMNLIEEEEARGDSTLVELQERLDELYFTKSSHIVDKDLSAKILSYRIQYRRFFEGAFTYSDMVEQSRKLLNTLMRAQKEGQ